MKDTLKAFKCAKCSEELGHDYHQMVQVLRNPHEANGKLAAGSLWWACARCQKPYYLIRLLGSKR
jgi:DNA-directed RNA polymerase subunit RPC12/RpoP